MVDTRNASWTSDQAQPWAVTRLSPTGTPGSRNPGPDGRRVGAGHLLGHVVHSMLRQFPQVHLPSRRLSQRPRSATAGRTARRRVWTSARARGYVQDQSHHHPSYVEPYRAGDRCGGIVRDFLAMGARPIGVIGPSPVVPLDYPDRPVLRPGVGRDRRLRQLSGLPTRRGGVFERSY